MLQMKTQRETRVCNSVSILSAESFSTLLDRPAFFETMRSTHGHIKLWPYHAARILKSAKYLWGISIADDLLEQIEHMIPGSDTQRLRFTFSYSTAKGLILYPEYRILESSSGQLTCALSRQVRLMADQDYSFIKSTSRLHYQMADRERVASGFDELLLLNQDGHLVEGIIHNLFILASGKLYTPPLQSGCVAGVCRAAILEKASRCGIEVVEQNIHLSDLLQAEGILLSNALRGIRIIQNIENQPIKIDEAEIVAKKLNRVLFD
jgi:branched-subunit amino acid aminotransferase/4-amino-4-deoxychorismate lyase